jgi:anti-sigma B factor antagonist
MRFHDDPLALEDLIRKYLLKRLDATAQEEFESHYLACDDCFEQLRASELLISGLNDAGVDRQRLDDVLVFKFSRPAQLIRRSSEINVLLESVLEQKDTKVLIDLSRVSRIDSAGLGLLMSCYSHAVRNQGMLKLLNPSPQVQNLLRITHLDAVVEVHFDENKALESFKRAGQHLS